MSPDEEHFNFFFNNPALPNISDQSREGLLTKDECLSYASLKQMAQNKSPGTDGLSADFYLTFWDDLGPDLVDSLNYAFEWGEFAISQRRGVITLIPKKDKDKRYLKTGGQFPC